MYSNIPVYVQFLGRRERRERYEIGRIPCEELIDVFSPGIHVSVCVHHEELRGVDALESCAVVVLDGSVLLARERQDLVFDAHRDGAAGV